MRNTNYFLGNLFSLFFLLSTHSFSQTLMKDGIETKWSSGEIALHDGTKMKGQVRFNEVSKIVSYKENIKSLDSKSFKEDKVFSLLLIDSIGKKRGFYSFQFDNEILLFE